MAPTTKPYLIARTKIVWPIELLSILIGKSAALRELFTNVSELTIVGTGVVCAKITWGRVNQTKPMMVERYLDGCCIGIGIKGVDGMQGGPLDHPTCSSNNDGDDGVHQGAPRFTHLGFIPSGSEVGDAADENHNDAGDSGDVKQCINGAIGEILEQG